MNHNHTKNLSPEQIAEDFCYSGSGGIAISDPANDAANAKCSLRAIYSSRFNPMDGNPPSDLVKAEIREYVANLVRIIRAEQRTDPICIAAISVADSQLDADVSWQAMEKNAMDNVDADVGPGGIEFALAHDDYCEKNKLANDAIDAYRALMKNEQSDKSENP